MSKIANVFKAGDSVAIKTTATKPNGDNLPQAGKRGIVTDVPKVGRCVVDVPGYPLVNLPFDELDEAPKIAATPPPAAEAGASTQEPAAPAVATSYAMEVMLLSAIVPSLTNPRTYFDAAELQSLSDDIALNGLLQPVLVRRLPGSRLQETFSDRRKGDPRPTHELVAGERRYRALLKAGVRSVPVLIRELTDEQVLRMQLIENIQRADLHPLEEAQGYRRILDLDSQAGKSMAERQEELANSIKRSVRYVYQTLQLLKLCDFARQIFLEKKLDRTIALEIAKIGNEAGQIEATRRIAGLGAKGTDVINHPMSHSQAVEYRRSNHALLLADAPFNIKIELAGVEPCGTCPKMSANARDLFEEGAKLHDTCLDRSCYGKKNAAHNEEIAAAAKAKGQKVISGAAAKKLMPYNGKHIEGGYELLDERRYDVIVKQQGNSVRQILGKDMPLPVLVQNPHAPGFVEALPKAEITKLLKERGLLHKSTSSTSEADKAEERKVKAEKAYRWALTEQLLTKAQKSDQAALFKNLQLPIAIAAYHSLDNEGRKRVHKLLEWETAAMGSRERPKMIKHFGALNTAQLNQFYVATSVAHQLHVAQYFNPGSDYLEAMADILAIDAKAIKAKMLADAKAAEKAKADKAKTKATPATKKASSSQKPSAKKPNMAFMAALHKSPALAAVTGDQPEPRTEIVQKLWAYIKKHKLQDAKEKRFINCDDKLKALFGKAKVSMFEMAGLVGNHVKTTPFPAAAADAQTSTAKAANKTQWRAISAADALQEDMEVRIVSEKAKLDFNATSYAGALGKLGKADGDKSRWVTVREGNRQSTLVFHLYQLQLRVEESATVVPDKAAKPTAKGRATEKQMDLVLQGKGTLNPQAAWPFPLKGETKAQAQARIGKDVKRAGA